MQKEIDKNFPVSSKILDIKLENFQLSVLDEVLLKSINKDKINFEFNIAFKVDAPKKALELTLVTKFFLDDTKTLNIGELKTIGFFEIQNMDDILSGHNGSLPILVMAMFAGVLLSTSRGFLILKSPGTFMEGSIFPIIDPTRFFIQPEVKA